MTGPSSNPRGEHTSAPGGTWEAELVDQPERVIDDNAPDPKANRATRRAWARSSRRRKP
ncbi:hypothetical protein ABZ442_05035 [Streptomyces triculaminicus]|uniref:hypothetical protein n=1 Tax=Streptomyces triculaminicus TaxID=2816232 RepID=UPI0033DE8E5B